MLTEVLLAEVLLCACVHITNVLISLMCSIDVARWWWCVGLVCFYTMYRRTNNIHIYLFIYLCIIIFIKTCMSSVN